jgi:hypothetical protein
MTEMKREAGGLSLDLISLARYLEPMRVGQRIDETGVLLREGASVFMRRSTGGRFQLDLRRSPFSDSGRQVRVIGTYIGDDLIDVDEISPVDGAGHSVKF